LNIYIIFKRAGKRQPFGNDRGLVATISKTAVIFFLQRVGDNSFAVCVGDSQVLFPGDSPALRGTFATLLCPSDANGSTPSVSERSIAKTSIMYCRGIWT
jgi:hypothetical protein